MSQRKGLMSFMMESYARELKILIGNMLVIIPLFKSVRLLSKSLDNAFTISLILLHPKKLMSLIVRAV